jgi:hypothetical protein
MAKSFTSLDVLNSIQLLGMVLRCIPLSESEKENEFTYVVNFESALENELQVISVPRNHLDLIMYLGPMIAKV